MFGQESTIKPKYYNIYVAREIEGFPRHQIVDTFRTCVDDVVYVLINEAKRNAQRRGDGYILVTDNKEIAEKYKIKLMQNEFH